MGRLGDLGWAVRERFSAPVVAELLALAALGAGVAGIVIALDAKDKAEEAAAAPLPVTTTPAEEADPDVSARVDELNDRVAAIEESVSQLRTELADGTSAAGGAVAPETPAVPKPPELPEGLPEVPGSGAPEPEAPPKP